MKIFLGSDHAGFKLKEQIREFLDSKKIQYDDCGAYTEEPTDYSDYAFIVGKHVVEHAGIGILICGTGTGMCIAANKVPGVRAGVGYDEYSAKMMRQHNDANILCLRSREMSFSKIKQIISTFLKSGFSGDARHKKRLQKIHAYEVR